MAVLLAAGVLVHGWSLGDGLFLDDHWHQNRLRSADWSLREFLDIGTIEPKRFIETWWQERAVRWDYARPVSFALMKAIHSVWGDGDGWVVALHAASVLIHVANSWMVYFLCLMLTRHRRWSLVGGLLFVVYSHSVFAVGWLAAQNTLLATGMMLAAVLAYIRASRLDLDGPASKETDIAAPSLGLGLYAVATLAWILGMFARESTIVLPAILVSLDYAFGGTGRLRGRWKAYLIWASIGIAFAIWRGYFYGQPIPDIYLRRPDEFGGYTLWLIAKVMHYLCSAVWLSPMVIGPTGRYDPFIETPGDCALMAGILAVMGAGYFLACRRARGYWIWPLWLLLSVLPVCAILATPHTGYQCGVGFAVAVVLGPGLGDRALPTWIGRWRGAVATWFLVATCSYIPIYRALWSGMIAAEQYTVRHLADDAPPKEETEIFFLNLPFVNIYGKMCLQEEWGAAMEGVRFHVLTYFPNLMRIDEQCEILQLDERCFEIAAKGSPYFSGLLGRFLIEAYREDGNRRPFFEGERFGADLFDVEVIEADADGVRKARFCFNKELATPQFRFYLGRVEHPATRLEFYGGGDPVEWPIRPKLTVAKRLASGNDEELVAHDYDDIRKTRDLLFTIREITSRIIRTDLYITGPPYPGLRVVDEPTMLQSGRVIP
jgi:hypothetical protein